MRLPLRFFGLALVIVAAFWFTAENANEMVLIDFVFFRLRVSLPLLVFGNVLLGMGVSLVVGWRADQKALRRGADLERSRLYGSPEPFDSALPEVETEDRGSTDWR